MKYFLLIITMAISYIAYAQEAWRTPLVAKHPSGIYIDANDYVYGVGNKDYGQSSNSLKDVFLYKLAPNGDSIWVASIDGLANYQDDGGKIVVDNAGNVYVTGTLINDAANHYDKDVMVAKFDSTGNKLWQYDYNGVDDHEDMPIAIALASNNEIIVGANTREASYNDITLFKLDAAGNLTWKRHYDNANSADFMINMKLDSNNDIVILGRCDYTGNSEYVPAVIKYNLSGNLIGDTVFTNAFPQSAYEEYEILASDIDDSGNVYFYSHRKHTMSNFISYKRVTKANISGVVAMDTLRKPVGMASNWSFTGKTVVKADNNGDMIIGATLTVPWTSAANYIAKFTNAGNWSFRDTMLVPGNMVWSDYELYNIGVFSNNDILITTDRSWHDGSNFEYKMLVSKYTSSGIKVNEHTIQGFKNESGGNYRDQSNLSFDNSGNPVLNISTGPHQLTTLKLDTALFSNSSTFITDVSKKNKIYLYPNPANNNVTIELENIIANKIVVYSIEGKVVYETKISNNKINIALDGLKKGVYFISVNTEKQHQVLKLIKQ